MARRDSNLKERVNLVNIVNFMGLLEIVLKDAKCKLKSWISVNEVHKFTGFLRFESGGFGGVFSQKKGGAGGGNGSKCAKAGRMAMRPYRMREYIEHLLTNMSARRVFAWGVITHRPLGRELRVNFDFGSSHLSRGSGFFKVRKEAVCLG